MKAKVHPFCLSSLMSDLIFFASNTVDEFSSPSVMMVTRTSLCPVLRVLLCRCVRLNPTASKSGVHESGL